MTGYVTGTLTDDDGAAELLCTAEQSIAVAEQLGCPRLNLHGTGLDAHGLPVRPVRGGHRCDVAGRGPHPGPGRRRSASGPG